MMTPTVIEIQRHGGLRPSRGKSIERGVDSRASSAVSGVSGAARTLKTTPVAGADLHGLGPPAGSIVEERLSARD
jgi:hypothetical protein